MSALELIGNLYASPKLLEQQTINDRTVVCFYDPNTKLANLLIFNSFDTPNEISKSAPLTDWGYITHYIRGLHPTKEAPEVVSLYLVDLENKNYWWEVFN